jgi:hypothetical protein
VLLLSDTPISAREQDYFGYWAHADAVAEIIDSAKTGTPLTVAVTGAWGAGKTSLAVMVEARLAEWTRLRRGERPMVTAWFRAWLHDDAPNLGTALAALVAREANRRRRWWRRLLFPMPDAFLSPQERWRRRCALLLGLLALAAIAAVTPPTRAVADEVALPKVAGASLAIIVFAALILWSKAFGVAQDAARFVQAPDAAAALGALDAAGNQLGRLIGHARGDGRFVIFIDDLERCRPPRAIDVCEVTSQLLARSGVVTVLLADMEAIAASAEMKYKDLVDAEGSRPIGREFLEKMVQLQLTLPPPGQPYMEEMLANRRPSFPTRLDPSEPANADDSSRAPNRRASRLRAAAASGVGSVVVAAASVLGGLVVLAGGGGPGVAIIVGAAVSAFCVVGFSVAGFAGASIPVIGVGVAAAIVGLSGIDTVGAGVALAVVAAIGVAGAVAATVVFDLVERRRARAAADVRRRIDERIRELAETDQTDLERRALEDLSQENPDLVRKEVRSYLTDEADELRRVEKVIREHPPELPRSAKRMLNQARLLTRIARDRSLFDGSPSIVPEQLGKWVVLSERWPTVAHAVTQTPDLMNELEQAAKDDVLLGALEKRALPEQLSVRSLHALLGTDPRLGEVIERLIRLEPVTTAAGPRERPAAPTTNSPYGRPVSPPPAWAVVDETQGS